MSLLKNLFGKKEEPPVKTYQDFWNWFKAHEKTFYSAVKSGKGIEKEFFSKLSPKLEELKDGFYYLAGMADDATAELVITPDGIIRNIVFAEELVAAAPPIPNWKFTALKPALGIESGIRMANYTFDSGSLSFYAVEHENYPDEIDIVIVHHDFREEDRPVIIQGTYIFLDNYLGELNAATAIDDLTVVSKEKAEKELIPIARLKDYLHWREKEFVEKYSGARYNTDNDRYSSLEAELHNGRVLVAIVNSTLLGWDSKASHPWISVVEINYNGDNTNGMPDDETYELLNTLEEEILLELKDADGYLNIGRQTADNKREIYFACKDFRKPSKVLHEMTWKYSGKLDLSYEIYKDKYWQSFERFRPDYGAFGG